MSATDRGLWAELCFTARALAQTHPMSEASHRYRQQCVDAERQRQHVSEPADWAGTALLVGYCLRRAEEQHSFVHAGAASPAGQPAAVGADAGGEVDTARVAALAAALRTGDAQDVALLPAAVTVQALDHLIATELDKRHEHMREQLDDDAWSELGDYLAWWVVHGYALRASEQPTL